MTPPKAYPRILPVDPQSIPAPLKQVRRWFPWRSGPFKPTGKFDKVPVHPVSGRNMDPLAPANWFSFQEALEANRRGIGDGVGIALSTDHPIMIDGVPHYLVAVDRDNCNSAMDDCEAMWRRLGMPYVEVSPSGNGLRLLGYSRTPVKGGNAGAGRELYGDKHFVTVTGNGGRGGLCDFTKPIVTLESEWFSGSSVPRPTKHVTLGQPAEPEHPAFVQPVLDMLATISSDTDYETWRNIVYALASTGWLCARKIAHLWSAKASHRYDAHALDKLFDSFDPARGITLGTLRHYARQAGGANTPSMSMQMQPAAPPLPATAMPLLMTADELRKLPSTPYVVRNVLPARGLAAIYGEPGAGKSFLALHLAHALATGSADWFGFRLRPTPVVYVALEGVAGIGRRATALEFHSHKLCSDKLRFWCRHIHLLTREGVDLLAAEIVTAVGKGAVIIIDTLNQASPGADENSSQDMGRIIANANQIAAAVEGLVILVHHSGKNRASGLRGHSSLHAAMDAVIEVTTVDGKRKAWSITKAKDDSTDVTRDFNLVAYTVAHDEDGLPVTSCAVEHTVHTAPRKLKPPRGKHQKAALEELRRHLQQPGSGMEYKSALATVAAAISTTPGRENERAKEALEVLLRDGHLSTNQHGICLV